MAGRFKEFSDLRALYPASGQTAGEKVPEHDGRENPVRVSLETSGRKGKKVTCISGLQHNPAVLEEIARILKQYCGAGGTVKGMTIEIQGDQRARVAEKLRLLNYRVQYSPSPSR